MCHFVESERYGKSIDFANEIVNHNAVEATSMKLKVRLPNISEKSSQVDLGFGV
jgi:hypothetical protein